jgi:hypothetical protein
MHEFGARQLALDLPHAESFRRDDFLGDPSNESALALVDSWPVWPDRIAAIIGPPGSGKSHLAAIWAERSGARIVDAAALAYGEVPRALVTGALVVEDIAPERIDEAAMFHLLNLAREDEAFVLITANKRLDLEGYRIADLTSRLRALPIFALAQPGEGLLAAVMIKLFSRSAATGGRGHHRLSPDEDRTLAGGSPGCDRKARPGRPFPRPPRNAGACRRGPARARIQVLTRGSGRRGTVIENSTLPVIVCGK